MVHGRTIEKIIHQFFALGFVKACNGCAGGIRRDLLDRVGRPEHPRDLKDYPCLNVLQTTRRNNYRWEFEEGGREFEVAVESAISVNDFDFLMERAMDGLGLTYQPEPLATPHVTAGRLERVLDPYLAGPTAWHLYYPSRLGASAPLRAFVEFMRGRLRTSGRA